MHKIDTENRNVNNEFVDADASQGVAGTDLNAAWFNTIQRELCNAVEGLGGVLSSTNDGQLLKSLMKVGIKPIHIEGGTYQVTSSWKGSCVFLSAAKSFTINGYLETGSLVIVVPYWGTSSGSSITVKYGRDTVTLKKGSGFFGVCVNGEDELDITAYRFAVTNSSGDLFANNIYAKDIIDNNTIVDSDSTGPNGEYRPWQLAANWKEGQVKRVRCKSGSVSSYNINVYVNSDGQVSSVTIPAYGYREFMCVGTYTQDNDGEAGATYAVLHANGTLNTTPQA